MDLAGRKASRQTRMTEYVDLQGGRGAQHTSMTQLHPPTSTSMHTGRPATSLPERHGNNPSHLNLTPTHITPTPTQPARPLPQPIPNSTQHNTSDPTPTHPTHNPTQSNPNTTHFTPIPVQLISPSTQSSPSQHHHNPTQCQPLQYHPHLAPTPTPTRPTSHSPQPNSLNPTHPIHTIPNPIQLTQPQLDVTHAITFRGEEIAKLVACGIKHMENRNFSIGNGKLIAIAVGKKAADPKEVAALHTILTPHNPPVDLLTLTEPTMRGHIIGVCRISHTLAHDECRQSKWADSRWKYCNIITEAVQLHKPIPAKGSLGKWLLNKDVQLAITQQLQDIKLIPNGAAELYPRIKHGTQLTLVGT